MVKNRFGRVVYDSYPFTEEVQRCAKSRGKDGVSWGTSSVTVGKMKTYFIPHLQVSERGIEDTIHLAVGGSSGSLVYGILQYLVFTECRDLLYLQFTNTSANRVMEHLELKPIPQPTFSRGVQQLLKRDIMRDCYRGLGWYWFNASRMFNGDMGKILNEECKETFSRPSESIPDSSRDD